MLHLFLLLEVEQLHLTQQEWPNTRVYAFFDNIDISTYITPSGGSLGGNIVTDASGAVSELLQFLFTTNNSNYRWRTGERVFRLTSSSTDDRTSDVETSAEGDYIARGILETVQETIISTREPRLVREAQTNKEQLQEHQQDNQLEQLVGLH